MAQFASDDLKQSASGGFVYGVSIGAYSNSEENSAPGYTAEFNNALKLSTNTNDQLCLGHLAPVLFRVLGGAEAACGSRRAYLNHHFDQEAIANSLGSNTYGISEQAVVSGDYALSPSERYRLSFTARFYHVNGGYKAGDFTFHENDPVFIIGSEFIFVPLMRWQAGIFSRIDVV